MKILIIGATQGIGRKLLEFALADGHKVTALVRSTDNLKFSNPNVHLVKGDIRDSSAVAKAAAGQDSICICIGIPPSRKTVDVFSKGTENVLAAIANNTETKLIVVTGVGAGDSKGHGGFMYDRIVYPFLLKAIYEDKDRQEALIKKSRNRWIIVRPCMLTNGPRTGKYQVFNNLDGVTSKKISRSDVADFILKQLRDPTHLFKTPLVTY